MFTNMLIYNLDSLNNTNYREAALGYLNYFNGINPTTFCYLTNMSSVGAENSINEIYHAWFTDGSALWDRVGISTYGPPPGFVSGGCNPHYALDGCCPSGCGSSNSLCNSLQVTPPLSQPIQKSYKDWNTSWPQNSWTITEPAIYTQATYVRLISQFVNAAQAAQIKVVIQGFYNSESNTKNMKDTVIAYMRNISSPYSLVDSSKAVIDSATFTGNFIFQNASSGTYYIIVTHRNSIETWSKSGGQLYISGSSFSYDFSSDSTQAFGNNEIRVDVSPVTYAIYSGDVNQDGISDATDMAQIENDAFTFASGYLQTDINGDGIIDGTDQAVVDNNVSNFVSKIVP